MPNVDEIPGRAVPVSLVAGPLFSGLLVLFLTQDMATDPISLTWSVIPGVLLFGLIAMVVGMVIAFPVNWFVGHMLVLLARRSFVFRPMVSWMAIAAAIAICVSHFALGALDGPGVFAFALTAMTCAAYVHRGLDWE